uniref:Transcription termination factor n=1 Tax=Rhipicephalus zambeziensis TaxID=60191 RepID=A0A224Z1P6_9ACAR
MAACGIIWFRLLVGGRRCLHQIPASLPVKRLLNSVTISALQRCCEHEARLTCRHPRIAPLCTRASAQEASAQGQCQDLCSLLEFESESEYRAWRHDHKDLLLGVSDDRLASACRWLLSKNLELKALRRHPAILKVPIVTLQRRMAVIQKEKKSAELSSEAVLTLLFCPESLLSTVSDNGGVCVTLRARVHLLRQELHLSKRECLSMISRVPCLLSHDPELAQRKLAILKQSGISKEALLKDPWVFRYSEALIAQRVELCHKQGVPVRTWLLRCPDSVLQRHLQLCRASRRALGAHPDTPDYLAERLHCKSLEELVRRHPRLLSIRPPKLKEVLDLLFKSGYTAEQVRQYPRVLSASASRLRLRLQRMAAREAPLPSLYTLLLPEKVFERTCGRFFDDYPHKTAPSRPPECQVEE